jgi:quercetin dioxygenase-like cupin family protein
MAERVVRVRAGDVERSYWGPGDLYTFLVTGEESGGTMFVVDCLVGVGGGPPPHCHLGEDELFTITEGSIQFTVDGETRPVAEGESVFVARGVDHAYTNDGPGPARMIAVYSPAGMEGWFIDVCTPASESAECPPVDQALIDRMTEAGPRHGVQWAL